METKTFVATGDSFTEGMQDDLNAEGRHRGWADRVAAALAVRNGRIRYANLAIRGRLLDQVIVEQVPSAVALNPDLVSFHAGPNDVLRPKVDLPALLGRYEAAVEKLRATGADVLLFTVIGGSGGSGRTAGLLASRFGAFNQRAREVAERRGCLLVDLGSVEVLRDRRLWHEDRLHLSPEGHTRVAAAVLERLAITDPELLGGPELLDPELLGGPEGWWREALPPRATPTWASRGRDVRGDVQWARKYFAPWVVRRIRKVSSGDLMVAKQGELVEIVAPPDKPFVK